MIRETPRFRFTFVHDGFAVMGPVQGSGGFVGDLAILRHAQAAAIEGRALGRVYEPTPGHVVCYPDFSALGNGQPFPIPLAEVTIEVAPPSLQRPRKVA